MGWDINWYIQTCNEVGKPGDGKTIYISTDEIRGIVEKQNVIQGVVTPIEEIKGQIVQEEITGIVDKNNTIKGTVQEDNIDGIVEINNNIKGKTECQ